MLSIEYSVVEKGLAMELKKIYEGLTDEQKAKVRECKTVEEITALAEKEGIELPDEALDAIAGGLSVGGSMMALGDQNAIDMSSTEVLTQNTTTTDVDILTTVNTTLTQNTQQQVTQTSQNTSGGGGGGGC